MKSSLQPARLPEASCNYLIWGFGSAALFDEGGTGIHELRLTDRPSKREVRRDDPPCILGFSRVEHTIAVLIGISELNQTIGT